MSKAGSSAPLRSRSGWSKRAIRALTAPTDDGSGGAFTRVSLAAFVRRPQAEHQIGARRIIAEVLLPLRIAAANRFSPPAGPLRAAPRACAPPAAARGAGTRVGSATIPTAPPGA